MATYVHLIPDDLPEPHFLHDAEPLATADHAAEPQRKTAIGCARLAWFPAGLLGGAGRSAPGA